MVAVYRTALIIAFEEFFGRMQIFDDEPIFAKYCQKQWPNENTDRVVASIVCNRGLN